MEMFFNKIVSLGPLLQEIHQMNHLEKDTDLMSSKNFKNEEYLKNARLTCSL